MGDLREKFQQNLDGIAADFIKLYRLEFKREVDHLSDPLARWLDFRMRYIDPVPRYILLSNKFPKSNLPPAVASGLTKLSRLIQEGGDINGFQSKSINRFNDFSGKRKGKRTDLLWADWGITHLHITDNPDSEDDFFMDRRCSNGESWLLFCLFFGDAVAFIDVRRHEDAFVFSDQDLLVTVNESWPWFMERFKLKGIMPPKANFTNDEVGSLRRSGIATFSVIDGEVFIGPGFGVTSAATALRVTQAADRLRNWVDTLAEFAINPNGQLQKEVAARGVKKADFVLCLTPRGVAIYESKSEHAFVFGSASSEHNKAMMSLISPNWVLNRLIA